MGGVMATILVALARPACQYHYRPPGRPEEQH